MKKFLVILLFSLLFSSKSLAESYYFKQCRLSETVTGNYIIDLDKKIINANLKSKEGTYQEFTDEIKLVEKDRIVTEIIQNKTNEKYYFQYTLNANLKSVIRQKYIKKSEDAFILPDGPKKEGLCANVKADWHKDEIAKKEGNIMQDKNFEVKSKLPTCKGNNYNQWTDCQGTYISTDDYKYGGEWKNGKAHGKGYEIWKDGKNYVGEFKENKPHGVGTYSYPDGSKYIGQFKEGKRHGKGSYTFADGKIYSGKYNEGEIIEGTVKYTDGTKYVGKFKFGKPIGEPGGAVDENIRDVLVVSKKWIKLSEFNSSSDEQLKKDFNKKASELCSPYKDFAVLEKEIDIMEMDETPAFGVETVVKLGLVGTVKCK